MDKLGITVFDVAIIAVACFGALLGASAGFAHAVLFIGSWIVAGWAAWKYAKLIQPEVEQLVGSTELAYFLAMLAVFVAALIVLVMLTNALSRSVRGSPLAKPDRILGAGFGVLCAWVAVGTAFLFYGYLGPRALPPARWAPLERPVRGWKPARYRRRGPAGGCGNPAAGRVRRNWPFP